MLEVLNRRKKDLLISSSIFFVVLLSVAAYVFIISPQGLQGSPSEVLKCNELQYSGEGAINLVFFSSEDIAERYSGYLFSAEPFYSNKDKFNVYYIDSYQPSCEIYKGVAFLCYSRELVKKAASCPNDYIFAFADGERGTRSSSFQNVVSINLAHPGLEVTLHEFAHAFGNLGEEYVPARLPLGAPNCKQDCAAFQHEIDGCFLECSDSAYHRTIENGVMRTLSSDDYGTYNEKSLIEEINLQYFDLDNSLTGRVASDFLDCEKEIVLFEVVRNSAGEIIGKRKEIVFGCPSGNTDFRESLIFTDAPGGETVEEIAPEIDGETFYDYDISFFVSAESGDDRVEITVHDERGSSEVILDVAEIDGLQRNSGGILQITRNFGSAEVEDTNTAQDFIAKIINKNVNNLTEAPGAVKANSTLGGNSSQGANYTGSNGTKTNVTVTQQNGSGSFSTPTGFSVKEFETGSLLNNLIFLASFLFTIWIVVKMLRRK